MHWGTYCFVLHKTLSTCHTSPCVKVSQDTKMTNFVNFELRRHNAKKYFKGLVKGVRLMTGAVKW